MNYFSEKYGNKNSKKFIHGKYEAINQQMCLKTAQSSKFSLILNMTKEK